MCRIVQLWSRKKSAPSILGRREPRELRFGVADRRTYEQNSEDPRIQELLPLSLSKIKVKESLFIASVYFAFGILRSSKGRTYTIAAEIAVFVTASWCVESRTAVSCRNVTRRNSSCFFGALVPKHQLNGACSISRFVFLAAFST